MIKTFAASAGAIILLVATALSAEAQQRYKPFPGPCYLSASGTYPETIYSPNEDETITIVRTTNDGSAQRQIWRLLDGTPDGAPAGMWFACTSYVTVP